MPNLLFASQDLDKLAACRTVVAFLPALQCCRQRKIVVQMAGANGAIIIQTITNSHKLLSDH